MFGGERGGLIRNWNRSEGVIYMENGGKVYIDGANDGAFRIQGKNLRGVVRRGRPVGEVETSWNESLRSPSGWRPG